MSPEDVQRDRKALEVFGRAVEMTRKKNTKGQVISKRKDCRHPDLTGQNEFIRTLEAQAKSLGIPPEHARDKLVMHLDLK